MAAEVAVATVADVAAALAAAGIGCEVHGDASTPVASITHDSRAVRPASLFACLRGASFDGHEFAPAALAAGASALLVDHVLDLGGDAAGERAQLVVADTRVAVGPAASRVNGSPSGSMVTVGITGTNGKTTTTQLLAAVLDATGHRTGVVGTLHGRLTTPEATDLHGLLAGFVRDGYDAAVMEVSSHALSLHRVDGTRFDVVAFTNLGHDHLDLHGTLEEYFRAKSLLFDERFAPVAVINVDDPHGRLLADTVAARDGGQRVVEVSLTDLGEVEIGAADHRYRWRGRQVHVPIGGEFNVLNSLTALTIAVEVGIDPDAAVAAIATAPVVPGRFERIESDVARRRGITVIVDFAHTPEGLDHLLRSARTVVGDGGRLIAVFGAGGDRDRPKRPGMGAVVAALADRVVVTSDNPRTEEPQDIIDDIVDGIAPEYRDRTSSDPDRRAAIASALAEARRGDLVVIAGRGHEATQDLGSAVVDFDDRRVARELLDSLADADTIPTTSTITEDTP